MWRGGQIHVQAPASGRGDRDGAGDARVRRRLGRARQRRRRSGGRRRAAAGSALPVDDPRYTLAPGLALEGRGAGVLLRLLERGPVAPVPRRAHAAGLPARRLGAVPRGERRSSPTRCWTRSKDAESPLVLIQDYHFALLSALIKAERPDARVAIFWHIPWPNFEAFGICPWQREILLGMLGADLIGFHTQYHCNNFLETVDRALEARIDWRALRGDPRRAHHVREAVPDQRRAGVRRRSAAHLPRRAPRGSWASRRSFSAWGSSASTTPRGCPSGSAPSSASSRAYPEYRERLSFVQLAAPSRSRIKRYQELQAEVDETVRARSTGARHPALAAHRLSEARTTTTATSGPTIATPTSAW